LRCCVIARKFQNKIEKGCSAKASLPSQEASSEDCYLNLFQLGFVLRNSNRFLVGRDAATRGKASFIETDEVPPH